MDNKVIAGDEEIHTERLNAKLEQAYRKVSPNDPRQVRMMFARQSSPTLLG